jgi:hypothetical protein
MTTIRPADELGSVLAGRGQAEVLRARVEQEARRNPPAIVDFEGVLTASPSFADELFAKMAPSLLDEGRVVFENMPPSISAIARYVLTGRRSPLRV